MLQTKTIILLCTKSPCTFYKWEILFFAVLSEKIYLDESSLFVEYNEVSLKIVLQTFIKMNYQILKSYKFCYEAKLISLDWARYATPFKPGRKFSTNLAQSK